MSGCASSPPDFHACTELELSRGWCITVVSGRGQFVDDTHPLLDAQTKILKDPKGNPQTWWNLRNTTVQIPYFDYVELKKWIIKECKLTNKCDSKITSWDRSLETLDQTIIKK